MGVFSKSTAQKIAVGVEAGTMLYQWQQHPKTISQDKYSVGQILLSPLIGGRLYLASRKELHLIINGQVIYSPLSFDISKRNGFGSLSFPILLQISILGSSSNKPETPGMFIYLGGGAQWTKTKLYNRSNDQIENNYFLTYIGEVSINFITAHNSVDLFLRAGGGKGRAITMDFGIKTALFSELF